MVANFNFRTFLFVADRGRVTPLDYDGSIFAFYNDRNHPGWKLDYVYLDEVGDGTMIMSFHTERNFVPVFYYLIIPLVTFCFLSSFVFLIPVESGEKISFTLTLFLAHTILHGTLKDHIEIVAVDSFIISWASLGLLIYMALLCAICVLCKQPQLTCSQNSSVFHWV